jgi:secreted PhoX family phosphatase
MHHDGMHFCPLPKGSDSSSHGLLAVNHECTDDGLLHPGRIEPWTAEKIAKSKAAHGVSIVEVRLESGRSAQFSQIQREGRSGSRNQPGVGKFGSSQDVDPPLLLIA